MTLQEKILYCRKKQGLSQEALAEKIGVSRQAISKWETGEATPEILKLSLLATTFNVTVDWLLSEEEPEEAHTEKEKTENSNYMYDYGNYNYGTDNYNMNSNNANNIFDRVMNIVKRWSWLVGVYIAIFGLITLALGSGFRFIGNEMIGAFKDTSKEMFNSVMEDDYYNGEIIAENKKAV